MNDHVTIIAEAGVNHNGRMDLAVALIDAAADAGADLVKFQTFRADHLAKASAPKAAYQDRQIGEAVSQHAMLKALELPYDWHKPLQDHAAKRGIGFISTAFDRESLRFLAGLDLPLFKIPSGELTNGPLLWHFARTGKPLVLSTGMATLSEVEEALAVVAHALMHGEEPASRTELWQNYTRAEAQAALKAKVTLLHCTSQYPTRMEEVNLRSMATLAGAFGLPVGYSDHTEGIHVPTAAVALGARVIEKHLTTDRSLPGPDHAASLEPGEFADMVRAIRAIGTAMGPGGKGPQPSEWNTREAARQRLVATRDLAKGTILTADDLTTARAAAGVLAMEYWDWIGRPCPHDMTAGQGLIP